LFALPLISVPTQRIRMSLPVGMELQSDSGTRIAEAFQGESRVVEWIPESASVWNGIIRPLSMVANGPEGEKSVAQWVETNLVAILNHGHLDWHATVLVHPLNDSVRELRCRLPEGFRLIDVALSKPASWTGSAGSQGQGDLLHVSFPQPMAAPVELKLHGTVTDSTDQLWNIAPFRWESETPQVTRLHLAHHPRDFPQIVKISGTRPESYSGTSETLIEGSALPSPATEFHAVRFTPAPGDFEVQFRQGDTLSRFVIDLHSHTSLTSIGAESTTRFLVLPLGGRVLRDPIEVDFPSDWTITDVRPVQLGSADGSGFRWKVDSSRVDRKKLIVVLPADLQESEQVRFDVDALRVLPNWPLEVGVSVLALPRWTVANAYSTTGQVLVSSEEPLQYKPLNLNGLSSDSVPQNSNAELSFRVESPEYSGEIELTRFRSRLAAYVSSVARLERDQLRCQIECTLQISGSGRRDLQLTLPEECGMDPQFKVVASSNQNEISAQLPGEVENGLRKWSLRLKKPAIGELKLSAGVLIPRGDSAEFPVPSAGFPDAERLSGQVIVNADAEQFLTVKGTDPSQRQLPELIPTEFVKPVSHPLPERIAAAFRTPGAGCRVVISEQRFTPQSLPAVVCNQLRIKSVQAPGGQNAHEALWTLQHSRIQGLILELETGQEVWSVLLDDAPVEISPAGEHQIKIRVPVTEAAAHTSRLRLLYGRRTPLQSSETSWSERPPLLLAEYSLLDRQPVDILDQNWEVFHPRDLRIVDAEQPYLPARNFHAGWWDWLWQPRFDRTLIPRLFMIGLILTIVLLVRGLIWLIRRGHSLPRLILASGASSLILLVTVVVLFLPSIPASRMVTKKILRDSLERSSRSESFAFPEFAPTEPAAANAPATVKEKLSKPDQKKSEESSPLTQQSAPSQLSQEGESPRNAAPAKENKAKLSVVADLIIPPDYRSDEFRMPGVSQGGPPQLILGVQNDRAGRIPFCLTFTLVLMLVWFVRRAEIWRLWVFLGVCLPLGLGGFLPPVHHHWLQAILLGTLCGLIARAIEQLCSRYLPSPVSWPAGVARKPVVSAVLLLGFCSATGSLQAEDSFDQPPASPPVVFTYSDPKNPDSAEQVWVPWDQYLQLRTSAGRPLESVDQSRSGVHSLELKAEFPPPKSTAREVRFQARLAIFSSQSGPTRIALPLRKSIVESAQLDGAPANLTIGEGGNGSPEVVVSSAGAHVLDLTLIVPFKAGDLNRGQIQLPIAQPATGSCEIRFPPATQTTLEHPASGVSRRRADSGELTCRFAIGGHTDFIVGWGPENGEQVVPTQGDLFSFVRIGEFIQVRQHLVVRGFGREVPEIVVEIPQGVLPVAVSGKDVRGWNDHSESGKRLIKIVTSSSADQSARLNLEYLIIPSAPTDGFWKQELAPLLPQGFSPEKNVVAVAVSPGKTTELRLGSDWRQIDPSALPENGRERLNEDVLSGAWEQSTTGSVPFPLAWKSTSPEQEVTLLNRWHLKPQGARLQAKIILKSSLTESGALQIPLVSGLFIDRVTIGEQPAQRWFVVEEPNGDPLLVVLPQLPSIPQQKEKLVAQQGVPVRDSTVELEAWFPLDPQDFAEFQFPVIFPRGSSKLRTFCGISLDPVLQLDLQAPDWESLDPSSRPDLFSGTPPRFAFRSDQLIPSSLEVRAQFSSASLAGTSLTIIDVRDEALDYLLALQWDVRNGESDTFVFTTPEWLMERLEFVPPEGGKAPRVSVEKLPSERARWTLTFDAPQREKVFLIAQATLPVSTDGIVRGPALQFVDRNLPADWQPLDNQSHFQALVNHSRNQLQLQPGNQYVRAHQNELLKSIQVPPALLVQSIGLLRQVEPLSEPAWTATPVESTPSIPASIGLAGHLFWMTGDDTWRSRATYRVSNRSRQFLPLEIPPSSKILALTVGNQAVRVLSREVEGRTIHLIPLPRMYAGDLPVDVKLILTGKLPVANPLWGKPAIVDIPLPKVVSPRENPELGIEITREIVDVYYPRQLSANLVGDPRRTNVDVSGDQGRFLDELETLLGEIVELTEIGSSSNLDYESRTRARSNLKSLELKLDAARNQLGTQASGTQSEGRSDSMQRSLQLQKRASEIDQKLGKIRREVPSDETQQFEVPTSGNGVVNEAVDNFYQRQNTIQLYNLNRAGTPLDSPSRTSGDLSEDKKSKQPAEDESKPLTKDRQRFFDHDAADLKPLDAIPQLGSVKGRFGSSLPIQNSIQSSPQPAKPSLGMEQNSLPEQPASASVVTPSSGSPSFLSLNLDFAPQGKRQTFSKVQGGANLALRVWPHAWFGSLARAIWGVALLALGIALLGKRSFGHPLVRGILLVVLLIALLFGNAILLPFVLIMLLAVLVFPFVYRRATQQPQGMISPN